MGNVLFKKSKESLFNIPKSFWELHAKDIDGNELKFEDLKGKKAFIVVNVASACGYTGSNYKGLVELYNKYKDQGLEILAFPSNQFMGQESKCELDIKNFAKNNFSVDFPMFSKIDVNGPETHEVFRYLRANTNLYDAKKNLIQEVPWNFTKFLVDADGKVLKYYGPGDTPNKMEEDIKPLLA